MSQAVQLQERRSNQQSFAITTAIIAGLLLLLLFIKLQHPVIEDAISGVMIDFGDNKEGLGNDNLREAGGQSSEPQKTAAVKPEPATPTPPTPNPPINTTATPVKSSSPPDKTVVAEDPNAVAIAKMKKEEEAQKQKALLEQQRIADIVRKAEADRIAREAKLAEERRISQEASQKVAGVFSKSKTGTGNGTGTSNGNGPGNGQGSSTPGGNQGAQWGKPGGDPNGTGTGPNGKGPGSGDGMSYDLKGRTWRQRPLVFDNSQKTGKVVVSIKVDKAGNVIYAKYQQKGSTTTDIQLIQLAEQGAMKAKFSPDQGADEEQFGTISFKFSVQ